MRVGVVAIIFFAMAGLGGTALLAQEMSKADGEVLTRSGKALDAGRYLDAADLLRPVAFEPNDKPKKNFIYDQWVAAETLMKNEPPRAAQHGQTLPKEDARRLRAAVAHDAITEIVARAQKTNVVFLNEDHSTPRSRAFALEVARALRPLGYTFLAVETLANVPSDTVSASAMAQISVDGYVRRSSGYYTADPVFADFLRRSLALGYHPIAYESTTRDPKGSPETRIAAREQGQANYLVERGLKAHPGAKLLVYVGFSHAAEEPLHDRGEIPTHWLANRLKTMTGINPLTIDQTTLGETSSYGGPAAYDLATDKAGRRSIVPFFDDKPLVIGQYEGAIDLQVVHPRTHHVGGRPDWLQAMGRTPTQIPQYLLPVKGVRLVQAFVASEADDAIPVDQVLVTAGMPPPMLMLPKVPVRFAYQDPAASAR